jgi:hypothetical protein
MSFKKVAWVFDSPYFNLKDPNLRIKNLIHTQFNVMGWDSRIVHPNQVHLDHYDAAIFCSVDEKTYDAICRLKEQGTKTLFHHMESIFGFPMQREIFSEVDGVVCVSASLAYFTETVSKMGKCYHIDDPVDDIFFNLPFSEKKESRSVVYSGGNPSLAELYRPHVERAGWKLKVIGYPNDGRDYFREPDDYGGNPYWWVPSYREGSVALCAHDFTSGVNKSLIKVITSWANGLIPVAAPIPSYRTAVDHGLNGFIYHNFESVTSILKKIDDMNERDRLTLNSKGFEKSKDFRSFEIAKKWAALIESI